MPMCLWSIYKELKTDYQYLIDNSMIRHFSLSGDMTKYTLLALILKQILSTKNPRARFPTSFSHLQIFGETTV